MKDPSNPRRDIEKFLAMGGGSFDALLNMLDEEPVRADHVAHVGEVPYDLERPDLDLALVVTFRGGDARREAGDEHGRGLPRRSAHRLAGRSAPGGLPH